MTTDERSICIRTLASCIGAVLLSLAFTIPTFAQARSYDVLLEEFFSKVGEAKYAEAVDKIAATNPWLAKGGDQMTTLKNSFNGLGALLGEYIGHEQIVVQPLGDRFVYVMELAYFEREPLQFHFTFYKPKGSWQLFTISYDEDADVTAGNLALERLSR